MNKLTIIVAVDQRNGIGIDNKLPWHLPEDMAHFKRTTTGHTAIMGRKTFESIGRPLPNRRNIVLTRNPEWKHEGIETAASVDAAIALLSDEEAFVIGGAQIYQEALDVARKLIVTEIGKTFDCDAFFPRIDPEKWKETARERHHSEKSELEFSFVTYGRAYE